MAIYPGAEFRPLGPQTEPRMSAHDVLCFHTMVGSLAGTQNYFDDNGYYGVESHFGVGGSTDGASDGRVVQWQDTAFCADANLDGKPYVISIETSDGGDPNRPWSAKALDSLVNLGVWVCRTHDIPPVLIPDTKPGRRGLAYHRQGCDHSSSYQPRGWPYDMWRIPGGVRWSSAVGKTCPGDVRIRQLVDIVIPRIAEIVRGAPAPNPTSPIIPMEECMKDIPAGTNVETRLFAAGRPHFLWIETTVGRSITIRDVAYVKRTPPGAGADYGPVGEPGYPNLRGVTIHADRPGPIAFAEDVAWVTLYTDSDHEFSAAIG